MLTIVTKYSRIPADETKLKRYNAMIDTGKEPKIITVEWSLIIRQALRKKEIDLWFTIINLAILPDHIHINIHISDTTKENISKIIQWIKWYSSFIYNRKIIGTQKNKGKQESLRAAWYALTELSTQDHLDRAIVYVGNNHMKHAQKRWEELLKKYQHTSDQHNGDLTF